MEVITIIYILTFIFLYLYFDAKRKFSYWYNKNVYNLEPSLIYGNIKNEMNGTEALCDIVDKAYKEVKSKGKKYFGFYKYSVPVFIPIDLDLIYHILQKDFTYFNSHGTGRSVDEKSNPLSAHLFNLEDEKWKNIRAKLTPTFTSGKMKMMFNTIVECTSGLQEVLKEFATINDPVDIKDILGRFTTDVIGSVAFGIEINSIKNPNSEFRKHGRVVFELSLRMKIYIAMSLLLPKWLTKSIKINGLPRETRDFFFNLARNTVEYREKNNISRKDFMQLLIQLKNTGKVSEVIEESMSVNKTNTFPGLTMNEIAAQSFVFFLAGFETSATTMTFALLELAQDKEIQEKTREEIIRTVEKYDNKLTYEGIMEMEYLEKVVSETLRKHPPVSVLPRLCKKTYKVPETDLVIEAGTKVDIPVYSIHYDREYWPNPEKFDPERFTEENKLNRPSFTYMPFGEGPRTCIGLRFGKIQSKIGLCSILMNYRVNLNKKTQIPIRYAPGPIISVKKDVWLDLESIQK